MSAASNRNRPRQSLIKLSIRDTIIAGVIILIVFAALGAIGSHSTSNSTSNNIKATPTAAKKATVIVIVPSITTETLQVTFAKGTSGLTTLHSYKKGQLTISISGVASEFGKAFADGFYFFANPIAHPTHNKDYTLWINDQPVDKFLVGPLLSYRADHIYAFTIDAPGGRLTFGVGSQLAATDKSGSFTLKLTQK